MKSKLLILIGLVALLSGPTISFAGGVPAPEGPEENPAPVFEDDPVENPTPPPVFDDPTMTVEPETPTECSETPVNSCPCEWRLQDLEERLVEARERIETIVREQRYHSCRQEARGGYLECLLRDGNPEGCLETRDEGFCFCESFRGEDVECGAESRSARLINPGLSLQPVPERFRRRKK